MKFLSPYLKMTFILLIPLFALSCASIPQKEMDDARKIIMESEKINAAKYAPEELQSAKALLSTAENQVKQKENDKAKENAVKSKDEGSKAYYKAIDQFMKDQNEVTLKSREEAQASHADMAVADKYQEAQGLYGDVQKDMEKLKVLSKKLQQEETLAKPK